MPKVKTKTGRTVRFPYTKEGRDAAERMKKKGKGRERKHRRGKY